MNLKDFLLKYTWVVSLLLLFGVSYYTAGTLNAYLGAKYLLGSIEKPSVVQVSPAGGLSYHPDREAIIGRNLFQMQLPLPAADGSPAAVEETQLRAKLMGIMFFSLGSAWNRATLKLLQENKNEVYKLGEEVTPGVTVAAIEEKLIRVRYTSGREEEISLEESQRKLAGVVDDPYLPDHAKLPVSEKQRELNEYKKAMGIDDRIRKVSENEYVLQQAVINESLQNLNTLLSDARMVPNLVGEGEEKTTDGFRIFRIRQGSLFQKLGLQNGDVIKAINGVKMDNIERGFELLQQLRFQKSFNLDIVRGEQGQNMSYTVE